MLVSLIKLFFLLFVFSLEKNTIMFVGEFPRMYNNFLIFSLHASECLCYIICTTSFNMNSFFYKRKLVYIATYSRFLS